MQITPTIDLPALEHDIHRHIASSNAELGVAVRHVESGAEILVNSDALYPMASVFKIPILIETLAQVDEGKQALNMRIELRQEKKVLPSGVLVELDPGLQPTLHDLLMLMIIQSDNTATDMVLEQIGIKSVERRLQRWELHHITVKMSVQGLFDATFESPPPGLTPAEAWIFFEGQEPAWDKLTNQRTLENNVSSPREMAELIARLVKGELLSPESTHVALDIMFRQQLNARLPRFMPEGVPLAHKTGTFIQSRNDAGVIFLPDGSRLVIVTFAILQRELLDADPRESMPYIDRVDSAMGSIARSAYDAFAGMGKEGE
jgi:beta-lactamase class A